MKLVKLNISPLPFYDNLAQQNYRKDYAFGYVYPLVIHKNIILPFQVPLDSSCKTVEKVYLFQAETAAKKDITYDMLDAGLCIIKGENTSVLMYPGILPIIPIKQEGRYYLEITLGYQERSETPLSATDFVDYTDPSAPVVGQGCEYNINTYTSTAYGSATINWKQYSDLTLGGTYLEVMASDGAPRFYFNRQAEDGQDTSDGVNSKMLDIYPGTWGANKYMTIRENLYIIDLDAIRQDYGYVHLHSIKSVSGQEDLVAVYIKRIRTNVKGTIYSDIFTSYNRVDDYLKLEYSNTHNFKLRDSEIDFSKGFKFVCYLSTQIGKPEYEFEEEATSRLGYKFVESQVSKKIYKFTFLAPEYLCDALRLVRLCDYKHITSKLQEYDLMSFSMEPKWEEQGDLAAVECEFETDNVLVTTLGGPDLVDGDFNNDFNNDFNIENG